MKVFFSSFFILSFQVIFCQSIAFFGDVMINADHADHRIYAANQFAEKMIQKLENSDSFYDPLADLPWVSVQYPQDSSFRMISWQIDKGEGNFEYHGYFQSADKLMSFGPSQEKKYSENDALGVSEWNGGLIYKILSLPDDADVYYVLSFKQIDQFTKTKSLEPLRITSSGPTIGIPNFFRKDANSKPTSGLTLTYSADVSAGFTLDEQSKRIVYDNLVLVQGRLAGQGPAYVPDGSYQAYQLEKDNSWSFVDKVYDQWNEGPLDPEFGKNRKDKISKRRKN